MTPGKQSPIVGGRALSLAAVLTLVALTLLLAWPQAAPAQGTWSETGPMRHAREGHTATRLADGRVLVAGGYGGSSWLASAELFNPATGTWASPGSLATERARHTATLLADGRVLVAGGEIISGSSLDSVEFFDPAGTWTSAAPLATARCDHTATLLNDGRVLVAGGSNLADRDLAGAEVFNPATGTWASPGSLATGRAYHTATLLADGRVLVAGGYGGFSWLASAELFHPATGIWSPTGSLATERANHTATLLADGRVLVAGGYGKFYLASAELFHPATGTWSPTGSMAGKRAGHTATRLADGRVLVAGGLPDGYNLASAELFNPATGTWSPADSLATSRGHYKAALLGDGRVLVAGGYGVAGAILTSAELYDPLNFVSNASFETSSVDPIATLPGGSTALLHWTVGAGGIDYRQDWQSAEARRSLDLNASDYGSIRQSFATTSRTKYLVTFAMAGNPMGEPAVKTLRVSAAGQFQDFTFDSTGRSKTDMGWTTKSCTFTATGTTTTLEFLSLTGGSAGPALDQVRVIRVKTPLPPLLPLLLD